MKKIIKLKVFSMKKIMKIDKKSYFSLERKFNRYKSMTMNERFQEYKDLINEFIYLKLKNSPILQFSKEEKTLFSNDASSSLNTPSNDSSNRGPIAAAHKISNIFSKYNIPVVIGGSVGLMSFIQPRYTKDLDINILMPDSSPDLQEDSLKKICNENGMEFLNYTTAAVPNKISKNQIKMTLCYLKLDGFPIDVFINKGTPVYDKLFNEAKLVDGLKIAPAEFIIFFKMMVLNKNNKSRYYKDMHDIVQVLNINRDFNKDFVRERLVDNCGVNSNQVKEWDEIVNAITHSENVEDE